MHTLLKRLDDVKYILIYLDPYTGNYAVLLETDQGIIDIPVIAGKIDPFSLLYRQGEIDRPGASVHESGFVAHLREDSTIRVFLKELIRWPFRSSVPADFEVIIWDRIDFVPIHGIPPTDTLVILQRPVQQGEISERELSHVNVVARKRERDKESGRDPVGQTPTRGRDERHLHIVPAGDPGLKTASPELQLSLHRIPPHALAWPLSLGLPFGACVLYLIIRRFPAKRRQSTEKLYSDTGAKQLTGYITLYKPILLQNVPGQWKHLAKGLKTTLTAVKYWHTRLRDAGLVVPVGTAKPGVRTARRVVARTEKERRENLWLARKVRQNPWQPHKALIP